MLAAREAAGRRARRATLAIADRCPHVALARWRAASERLSKRRGLLSDSSNNSSGVLATREREGEGSRFDRVRSEQELVDVKANRRLQQKPIELAARGAILAMLPPEHVRYLTALPGRCCPPPLDPGEMLVQKASHDSSRTCAPSTAAARRFALEAEAAKRAVGARGHCQRRPQTRGQRRRRQRMAESSALSVTLPLFNQAGS